MKYMNIVIAGDVASGKSTLSKKLSEALGWKRVSAGDYFREYMKEHSISLYDKQALPDGIDVQFDKSFKKRIKTEEDTVFEGHYQGWNARDLLTSYKILVLADQKIAFERAKFRLDEPESQESLMLRSKDLKTVFKKLYGDANYLDPMFFNLVIDNSNISTDELVNKALTSFEKANI